MGAKQKKRLCRIFYEAGYILTKRLHLDQTSEKNRGLHQEITALALGDAKAVTEYYAEKVGNVLGILAIVSVLSLMVLLFADKGEKEIAGNHLKRPGYGSGSREEELILQIGHEKETELLTVTIQEQKYTKKQAATLLQRANVELEQQFLGKNLSRDEIRTALCFPTVLQNGAVTVEWMTSPYGMIDEEGVIVGEPPENGCIVEIQGTLRCQEQERVYETAVCVYPPVLTEREQILKKIVDLLHQRDEEDAHLEIMRLPVMVDGRKLTWQEPSENLILLALFLTVFLPMCAYIQKDHKIHEKAKVRRLQLEMDYSKLMWKMTMLLGAGLTIRGAFTRIAMEYKKEHKGAPRYVYEEMLYTCNEMKSGVSEAAAYENFGRRCELPRYIKLGTLLSQNLKKGSKGLIALLEKEAVFAMEERKSLARKLGEQAGTKMMFPMILMFAVVLIILVVPAFLSF